VAGQRKKAAKKKNRGGRPPKAPALKRGVRTPVYQRTAQHARWLAASVIDGKEALASWLAGLADARCDLLGIPKEPTTEVPAPRRRAPK
jgi:hypothetical protein